MKNDPQSSPSKPPLNIAGRLWKIVMGLFLVGIGIVFVQYLWGSYQRAALMNTWVETPCVIETAQIDDSELNQRGVTKYILEVTFGYEFEGQSYVSNRLKRLKVEGSDPKKITQKLKEFPAGTETACYVNPDDPAFAVLKKDSKAGLYTIWFPCLIIVGGGGMILTALFRRS